MMIGSVPTTDLTIAAGKKYTFLYGTSLFSDSESTLQAKLPNLASYASNISLSKSFWNDDVTLTLTPTYAMPLSAWTNLISENLGMDNLKDLTVGTFSGSGGGIPSVASNIVATLSTPAQNIETYWSPKIQSAEAAIASGFKSVTSGVGSAFDWIKWVAIAGAVMVGGVAIMTYLPKPHYKENPRRRYRRIKK